MKLDIYLSESNTKIDAEFKETHEVSGGGFSEGYDQGHMEGYNKGHTEGVAEGYTKGKTDGESIGYQNGYTEGKTEGVAEGKQAERDAFWEQFQNHGKGINYLYAFSYGRFNDSTYNPKYDIIPREGNADCNNIFYTATQITDTKVAIYANDVAGCIQGAFYKAMKLVTIRKLVVTENTTYSSVFHTCTALKNITFEGTIGQNMDVHWSTLLTHESLMSIIEHLGTVTATRTLTLGTENLAKLTDTEKAIATQKGWTLA